MKQRFFRCTHCGQIIALVKETGVPIICCGEKMQELVPNTIEASTEKHIPVYTISGNTVSVTVGSTIHPMEKEHYIEWISLQTKNGNQRVVLKPNDEPKACFKICDGDVIEAVYAYCNLHSLWIAK